MSASSELDVSTHLQGLEFAFKIHHAVQYAHVQLYNKVKPSIPCCTWLNLLHMSLWRMYPYNRLSFHGALIILV